jgi:hypothetical protein
MNIQITPSIKIEGPHNFNIYAKRAINICFLLCYTMLYFVLSIIRLQFKDDGGVAEHGVEIGVEEMREQVDGVSTIRQVVGEEVIRRWLACVHQRLPAVAWALWESNNRRQMAGVEGHVDLAFRFIFRGEGHETACLRPVRFPRLMAMPMQPLSCWEVCEAKGLALFAEFGHKRAEPLQVRGFFFLVPAEIIDIMVMAVCVVVASFCMAIFIAHVEHRNTLRNHERNKEIAHLPLPQSFDRQTCKFSFLHC